MKWKDHPIFTTVSEYLKPWENPTTIKNKIKTTAEAMCAPKPTDIEERDRNRMRQLEALKKITDAKSLIEL